MLLFCAIVPATASAYEPERARLNLAHDAAECAAYFNSVSAVPVLRPETKNRLIGYGKDLIEFSIKLTNRESTLARVQLATQTMNRELGNNWGHLSTLNDKYGSPCRDLVAEPDTRMQYWLDRRD